MSKQSDFRLPESAEVIRLRAEDQRRFAGLLLEPPPPTAAMVRANEAHSRLIQPWPGTDSTSN